MIHTLPKPQAHTKPHSRSVQEVREPRKIHRILELLEVDLRLTKIFDYAVIPHSSLTDGEMKLFWMMIPCDLVNITDIMKEDEDEDHDHDHNANTDHNHDSN